MTMTTTSILLADDHQVVLDGLMSLISREEDMTVVGQANDGLQVLPAVLQLHPDVLVLDLMMPGLNGLEVSRQMREKAPQTKVIVLSMHSNDAYVVEALRNGVAGYVLKQAASSALLDAVRAVRSGERYLSPPLSMEKVERWELETKPQTFDLFDTLSAREREVLQLSAEGLTSAVIADRLKIGRRTVETHRANIQRKLGLKTHAELVRLAVKRGLVDFE
jgi:two-component system, NarL family, response regulator NreC